MSSRCAIVVLACVTILCSFTGQRVEAASLDQVRALGGINPVYDIEVGDGVIHAACGTGGLVSVWCRTDTTPYKTNRFTGIYAAGIDVAGTIVYVADEQARRLRLIDVSNPNNIYQRQSLLTPGTPQDVTVVNSHAYIADGTNGLQIAYVANPDAPYLMGRYDTPGYANYVAISGTRAYVADGIQGLRIVDVSSGWTPYYLGYYWTGGYARDLFVVNYLFTGTYVFMADGGGGLRIIDASTPATASLKATVPMSVADSVAQYNGFVCVGDSYNGIHIIDVSDLSHPKKKGRFPVPNNFIMGFGVDRGKLWAGMDTAGVKALQMAHLPNDYNGDGLSDLAAYQESTGSWYIRSLGPVGPAYPPITFGEVLGGAGQMAVGGDYSGDAVCDLAVYNRTTGRWRVRKLGTSGTYIDAIYGGSTWSPVWGRYFAGLADWRCVFEVSSGDWKALDASGMITITQTNWGGAGMVAVPGDYNGDGIFDFGLYETATGNWYIRDSMDAAAAPICFGQQWGGAGMVPVPGDYNGDGVFDLCVYQLSTGNWFIRKLGPIGPSNPPISFGQNWGGAGLYPVPGDYNGDGVWDLAAYQTSTGNWFIRSLGPVGPAYPPICFGQNWGGPGLVPPGMVQ